MAAVPNKPGGRTKGTQIPSYNIPDLEDNQTPLSGGSRDGGTGNPPLKRDALWNDEPFSQRGYARASGGMGHDLDRY